MTVLKKLIYVYVEALNRQWFPCLKGIVLLGKLSLAIGKLHFSTRYKGRESGNVCIILIMFAPCWEKPVTAEQKIRVEAELHLYSLSGRFWGGDKYYVYHKGLLVIKCCLAGSFYFRNHVKNMSSCVILRKK